VASALQLTRAPEPPLPDSAEETIMTQRLMTFALALGLAVALTACSTSPTASITSITVTSATVTAGGTVQLKATANYSDGTTADVSSSSVWSSSNTNIATVSATGVVQGKSDGLATITSTFQSSSGTATITVTG
jgi:hypothetical protein